MAIGTHKYTVQEAQNAALGQAGSIFVAGAGEITATNNSIFVAIQFLEDTVFDSSDDGLKAVGDRQSYPDSTGTCKNISVDDNGAVVNSETFPAGMTIYGRWLSFKLSSGKVIAYVG
jgi:hypothetical protein